MCRHETCDAEDQQDVVDAAAEQIADGMSKNGGIGIAEQMYSQALARQQGAVVNATTDETDRDRAMRMITDFERQVLGLAPTDRNEA